MTTVNRNGYTEKQLDSIKDSSLYKETLKALENSEGYISSSELEHTTNKEKSDITTFLGVLRTKNYIEGRVVNGEYLWNSKPKSLEWNEIEHILDENLLVA